jgi:hypothetical protein
MRPCEALGDHRGRSQQSRWSLGWVSAIDSNGDTIWIIDAHRGNGHCVDRANEIFAEMRRVTDWLQQKANGASASLDFKQRERIKSPNPSEPHENSTQI